MIHEKVPVLSASRQQVPMVFWITRKKIPTTDKKNRSEFYNKERVRERGGALEQRRSSGHGGRGGCHDQEILEDNINP